MKIEFLLSILVLILQPVAAAEETYPSRSISESVKRKSLIRKLEATPVNFVYKGRNIQIQESWLESNGIKQPRLCFTLSVDNEKEGDSFTVPFSQESNLALGVGHDESWKRANLIPGLISVRLTKSSIVHVVDFGSKKLPSMMELVVGRHLPSDDSNIIRLQFPLEATLETPVRRTSP